MLNLRTNDDDNNDLIKFIDVFKTHINKKSKWWGNLTAFLTESEWNDLSMNLPTDLESVKSSLFSALSISGEYYDTFKDIEYIVTDITSDAVDIGLTLIMENREKENMKNLNMIQKKNL